MFKLRDLIVVLISVAFIIALSATGFVWVGYWLGYGLNLVGVL
jgi:hypothetical protein